MDLIIDADVPNWVERRRGCFGGHAISDGKCFQCGRTVEEINERKLLALSKYNAMEPHHPLFQEDSSYKFSRGSVLEMRDDGSCIMCHTISSFYEWVQEKLAEHQKVDGKINYHSGQP